MRRESARDVAHLALGILQSQNEHVFGKPSFFPAEVAGQAQRHAFLPEKSVAAITRADRPYRIFFRKVNDEAAVGAEVAEGMQTPREVAGRVQMVERDLPTRVMMRMFRTTYLLSVISTPTFENREPGGPIRKGTTYIVRPFMAPLKSGVSLARESAGDIQLLFGPASSCCSVLMKVRCSVRATSWAALRWR